MTRHELPYISDYYDRDGNPTTPEYRRQRMAEGSEQKSTHQVPPGTRLRREEVIKRAFAVRQPVPGHTNQARHIRDVRAMGAELARVIVDSTPECADQSAALRKVREAVMTAEEAIHLEGMI